MRTGATRSGRGRFGWKAAALALAAASWPAALYGHGGHADEPLPFDALVLVFGMIPWNFRVDILLVLVLATAVYLTGWSRLRRQADGAATLSGLALYLAGIAALFTALVSPVDRLAAERLSMHMVQHILLLMIAPLGILLANPFAAVVWGLPAGVRERFAGLFRDGAPLRSALSVLTLMPVAWTLYVVNLWGWHHPALYQAALEYWWLHDLEHWLFFGTAVLFWWPIVNAAPLYRPTRPLGARVVYLVAATLQNTLLGMAISLPERILYPFYAAVPVLEKLSPIQDQALGGGIMWVSGHMYIVPILVLIARRLIAEDEAVNAAGEGGDGGLGTVPRHG
ncbi:MAG: cytochrome c oxidase assembly protein [Deltaproteobacteria bacterium]|nr:cytochrome c oxidase assembly protein [Deltaproteobacteria bacterium]